MVRVLEQQEMIINSFTVTITDDGLPPKRSWGEAQHRQFKLEELMTGHTQVIDMNTANNSALVKAIMNYLHHTLERDGTRLYRTVREPDRLIVRRVY